MGYTLKHYNKMCVFVLSSDFTRFLNDFISPIWTSFNNEDSLVHSTWITELHSHFVLMKIHTKFIYLFSEALMVCDTTMMIYTHKKCNLSFWKQWSSCALKIRVFFGSYLQQLINLSVLVSYWATFFWVFFLGQCK